MINPSVILFDLDGTLLNSEQIIIDSWRKAHYHVSPTIKWEEEKLIKLMGQPALAIPKGMGIPKPLHKNYVKFFRKYLWENELPLFDDVKEVLSKLIELNIPIGVVTGARTKGAIIKLKKNNIFNYFTVVIGADLTIEGKPSPDPIYLALERINSVSKENKVLFVGDSINDMLAAKSAGVVSVLIWRKSVQIPNSIQRHADIIISDLYDLLVIIKNSSFDNLK